MRKPPTPEWISVTSDSGDFGLTDAALNGDIPWPKTTPPSGRVKFLNREKGIQLGYVLKLPIGPNPTSALPEKYRKKIKDAKGFEFGPPDQVLYEGNFEFTLKDADGFVLTKITGPTEHLSAGSNNLVQNVTEQTVPENIQSNVKHVAVALTVTSCNPCTLDIDFQPYATPSPKTAN